MTPIRNPVNEYEEAYNVAHRKARNCVERCIGVLKGRFRILGKDRILRYSPAKSGVIINACAVLHNIMIEAGIPIETNLEIENDEEIEDEEHVNINEANANELQAGVAARQRLVTDFFS